MVSSRPPEPSSARRPQPPRPSDPIARTRHLGAGARVGGLVAATAVVGIALAACSGSDPVSVTPGLPTTAARSATSTPGEAGATIVLPKGTSPPGSNPLGPGDTIAPSTGAAHGGGASSDPSGEGSPQIGQIVVPAPLRCDAQGPAAATIDYRTSGAERVVLLVDGTQQPGLAPQSGPTTVTVPCDGTSHLVVIAAVAADGKSTIDSRVVMTSVAGATEVETGG